MTAKEAQLHLRYSTWASRRLVDAIYGSIFGKARAKRRASKTPPDLAIYRENSSGQRK